MPPANANGIRIEYETTGDPASEPLLLIQGFGLQLIGWPDDLCKLLADRGYYVIRFDNRDAGHSEWFDGSPPTHVEELQAVERGEATAPYTHDDMAADTIGLLDALGINSAHIVGMSIGSNIARKIAIRHPERVRSLVLMGSSSRAPGLPPPDPVAVSAVGSALNVVTRDVFIEDQVAGWRVLSGGHGHYDEALVREQAARHYDRGYHVEGLFRQRAAGIADLKRGAPLKELSEVRVPTLVIQGRHDPSVSMPHGEDLARRILRAELVVIDRMGHELHVPHVYDELVEAITSHARKAAAASV
jgi:pimeloyl-ACP methyl ester carboxylesterase